jgi:glycosyltransferase involved in cell wall biosynthesis
MNLVYFANASVPSRTANSVHIMKMCEALGAQGHRVRLIVPDEGLPELDKTDPYGFYGVAPAFKLTKTPWMPLHPKGVSDLVYVGIWGLWMRFTGRPDVCITRNLWAGVLFSMLGIRTVLELHGPIPAKGRMARLLRRLGTFRNPHLARLVVISESLRRFFLDFGVPADKIQVLHDAVNVEAYLDPSNAARNSELRTHRSEGEEKRPLSIGYVGSLHAGKGMEILMALAQRDSANRYHVYGGSPEDVARWRGAAGGSGNVTFHGHIPNVRVPETLMRMDVLLMPYLRRVAVSGNYGDVAQWMSPLKMFEYMAAGKAILCSDLPVLREVLEDGRNALLADPDDLDAWVRAVGRLSDAALRARLGVAARADVVREYTWKQRAKRILP